MSNKFFCCAGFFIAGLNSILLMNAYCQHWGWFTIFTITGLILGIGQGFYNYNKM